MALNLPLSSITTRDFYFYVITIVGFQRNGLHFLSFSLPAVVPLPLGPLLVVLELIPHCFHALNSGMHLFANMMADHSSVKILSGLVSRPKSR